MNLTLFFFSNLQTFFLPFKIGKNEKKAESGRENVKNIESWTPHGAIQTNLDVVTLTQRNEIAWE